MKLTNENALIGSLLGSKAIEQLPRFAAVENELAKHVGLPISFLPLINNKDKIFDSEIKQTNEVWVTGDEDVELWMADKAKPESAQFFPLSFKSTADQDWYLLPWEPMINIEASARIAERYIAKAGKNQIGSIKERWSLDDYNITITGAFYGQKIRGSMAETYPRYEMERLRDYLLTAEAIQVKCEPLQILNINRVAITSVNFPFTKGESVQAYEIKAKSDFPYNLIYKRKKKYTITMGDWTSEFIK